MRKSHLVLQIITFSSTIRVYLKKERHPTIVLIYLLIAANKFIYVFYFYPLLSRLFHIVSLK